MQLQLKGRNLEITSEMREYVESKFAKLDRQLAADTAVEVELAAETKHAQLTADGIVFAKGTTLRASESATEIHGAIDLLADNLDRQVQRYAEKRREEPRRRTEHH